MSSKEPKNKKGKDQPAESDPKPKKQNFLSKIKDSVSSKFSKKKPQPLELCPVEDKFELAGIDEPKQEPEKPPQPWKLHVYVKTDPATKWPKDDVAVSLQIKEGADEGRGLGKMISGSIKGDFQGQGHRDYTATASAKNWFLVAPKNVSLDDGDDKTVELVLKPMPWIALKVIYEKPGAKPSEAETVLEGVTINLKLPGNRKENPVTTKEDILYEGLKGEGNADIQSMIDDDLWEFVDITAK